MNKLQHTPRRIGVAFTFSAFLLLAGHLSATSLAVDSFDYTDGDGLSGLNGGSGWAGAWTNPGTDAVIASPGLGYTGVDAAYTAFPSTGNAVDASGAPNNRRLLDTSASGTFDDAGLVGTGGDVGGSGVSSGSLYGSVLLSSPDFTAAGTRVLMEFGPTTSDPFRIQQNGGGANFEITDLSNNNLGTGSLAVGGNDLLLVWRIDFGGSGSDDITLWMSPTSEADSSISLSSTRDIAFDRLTMRGVGSSNDYTYDEIRFGTSFNDVVPVPEPNVFALMLSAIAAGVVFVRRRR